LFISHDLSVVRYISDRIAVMYKGELVELGKTADIFVNPCHAYTKKLLNAALSLNPTEARKQLSKLDEVQEIVLSEHSVWEEIEYGHFVRVDK
jgi:ABC-type oligopeptide transport system ATPase subunit